MRSLKVRFAAVVFLIMMATPSFAMIPRDDEPLARFGRVFSRIVHHVRTVLDLPGLTIPPG